MHFRGDSGGLRCRRPFSQNLKRLLSAVKIQLPGSLYVIWRYVIFYEYSNDFTGKNIQAVLKLLVFPEQKEEIQEQKPLFFLIFLQSAGISSNMKNR